MQCPHCQHMNPDGTRFCTECGRVLVPQQPSPGKKGFSAFLRALCYYLLFIGIQTAVIMTYEFAVILQNLSGYISGGMLDAERYYTEMMELVLSQLKENLHIIMILSACLTLLVLFLSFHLRKKNPLGEMHFRSIGVKNAAFALLFGGALQVAVAITLSLVPLPQSLLDSFAQNSELLTGGPLSLQIVNTALLTPLLEELIFRGLVFTRLRRGMKTWLAVGLSAVVFGWAHGHIISFVYAGLLGVLLALLMIRNNDSVLIPVFCHIGFNGTSFLIAGITEITLPVFALYFASLAAAVVLGYLLLRKKEAAETEE